MKIFIYDNSQFPHSLGLLPSEGCPMSMWLYASLCHACHWLHHSLNNFQVAERLLVSLVTGDSHSFFFLNHQPVYMYAVVCSWQRLPRAFCPTSTSASFLHFFCHTTSTAYIHYSNCISRTFHGLFRWITSPSPKKHIYIPSACTVALSIKPINVQPLWIPRTLWSLKTFSPFFFSSHQTKGKPRDVADWASWSRSLGCAAGNWDAPVPRPTMVTSDPPKIGRAAGKRRRLSLAINFN